MDNNNKDKKWNKVFISVFAIITAILLIVLSYFLFFSEKKDKNDDKKLAYTELIKQIADGEIEKIEMTVGSTSVKVKQKNIYN